MNEATTRVKKSVGTKNQTPFRIGKVRGDLRDKVWYLTYFEHGHAICYAVISPLMEMHRLTH